MQDRDGGESLLEVMMALAILGIAVVAILGGMTTLVIGTDVHRQQSSATTVLLSAAETLKGAGTPYVACVTPAGPLEAVAYKAAIADTTKVPRPLGWAPPEITAVAYWNGATFQSTCYDTASHGNLLRLQQVTITVTDPGSRTVETMTVAKRSES